MSINEKLNQGQKEYGANSQTSYYKFERGDNRMRILTEGEVLATHFFGKGQKASTCYGADKGCPFHGVGAPKDDKGKEKSPSIKYVCYVVNKRDGETIQLADLPYSVIKQVGDYQDNIDYAFTSFPMPYDITVKFDPDSKSPNDMYKVIASPKVEPVSDEVMGKLADLMVKKTPVQHVQSKKDWQVKQHQEQGLFITEEKRAQRKKQFVETANAGAKIASQGKEALPEIEYPEEQINPDDIPF